MKKYRVTTYLNGFHEVNITKETDQFVFLPRKLGGETREKKKTEQHAYFDTFDEAKNWLINKHKQALFVAQKSVEAAELRLEATENMTESKNE